jgi:hypothetical protein
LSCLFTSIEDPVARGTVIARDVSSMLRFGFRFQGDGETYFFQI